MSISSEFERVQTSIIAAYEVMEGLGATMPEQETIDYLAATAATLSGVGSGESGATFIPSVDSEGNISWTNDKGLENPAPVNIRGPQGEKGADGTMVFEDLTEEQKASLKGDKGDTGPQGPQGESGEPGADGHTPQRGIDYWTDSDKEEILNEIGENVDFTPISNQEIDEICTYEGILS